MEASETIETLVDLLSAQSVLDSQTADIVQLMAAGAGWYVTVEVTVVVVEAFVFFCLLNVLSSVNIYYLCS